MQHPQGVEGAALAGRAAARAAAAAAAADRQRQYGPPAANLLDFALVLPQAALVKPLREVNDAPSCRQPELLPAPSCP